ncbi:MAG: ABC transporter permease [Candidatus Dormiibacterota bacterium]
MSFLQSVAVWFLNPANWRGADGIPTRTEEHVLMSLAAIVTAMVIALPIGIWLGHTGRGGLLAINLTNVGRAIPSFALLVLLLFVFGLGATPAFIALVVLAIPPIVTNSYEGMRSVDRNLIDSARGLGMRDVQVLWRVEIPLAMPVIMAGVRTAGVQVVATATLAALVAWGGLGRYIVDGLGQYKYQEVFAGALLVAILAGLTEILLALLQHLLTPAGLRKVDARPAAATATAPPAPEPAA